jgi:ABC-type sugar transport system substrate-binding protein
LKLVLLLAAVCIVAAFPVLAAKKAPNESYTYTVGHIVYTLEHQYHQALTTAAIKMARAKGIPMVTTLVWPSEKIAPHVQPMETPSSMIMGQIAAKKWLEANPD